MLAALLQKFPGLVKSGTDPTPGDEEAARDEQSDSESERSSKSEYAYVVFEWWPSFLPPQRLVMKKVK